MKKQGCAVIGCLAVAFFVVVAAAIVFVGMKRAKTEEANRRPVHEELQAPAGTVFQDGIAIAVMVDTSGSMDGNVDDAQGVPRSKIEIARKTTMQTVDQIAQFVANNHDHTLKAGLAQFSHKVKELYPMGPVNAAEIRPVIETLEASGGTAIGEALIFAKQQLNKAGMKRQSIILITDGQNTDGREPLEVVQGIRKLPSEQRPAVYLVAFDIKARQFQALTDAGVLVVEARDAVGLQSALDYILYEKILVEQP